MTGTLRRRPNCPRVVLIGPMGAGKSTVGPIVAELLDVEFRDTDTEIVARTGRTVGALFTESAELFRDVEEAVVAHMLTAFGGVLSLGGGAVLRERTRERLADVPVALLMIGAEAGIARVAGSGRPLLAGPDPAATYRRLMAEREEIYRGVASLVVDAEAPPTDVAEAIAAELTRLEAAAPTG